MALTSTLGAGPLTSTKSYDIDNTKAANMLAWFIDGWAEPVPDGLTAAQRNQWILDQAHQKLIDYFRAEVALNRQRLIEPEIEALREAARAETELPDLTGASRA